MRGNITQVAVYWNNVASEFDAIYSGEKSRCGRALDHWLRKDMFQRFDWVMKKVGGDVQGKTVCDLGCGSGRFAIALAKMGAQVTGVDIAPEMLKLACQLADKSGISDRCTFVRSDLLDWDADQPYDIAIAIGFWDYIDDPISRLQVIRKVTVGTFLSAWPRLWTWRMPIRKARLAVRGCPVFFFTRSQVIRMLREAGFEVLDCKVIGKLFCVEARPV